MSTDLINDNEIEKQKHMSTFSEKVVNFEMNNYVIENVLFGKLKPNDKIPFDKFVKELDIDFFEPYTNREHISGIAISKDETVLDLDYLTCAEMLYSFYMNKLIGSALNQIPYGDDYVIYEFKYNMKTYAENLFPIFWQIINTDLPPSLTVIQSYVPTDRNYYTKLGKFVVSIKTKRLRPNKCVDNYLADLPVIPYFIRKLIIQHKNSVLLANINTNGLAYKLAFLNAIRFKKPEHNIIFEMKMKEWQTQLILSKM